MSEVRRHCQKVYFSLHFILVVDDDEEEEVEKTDCSVLFVCLLRTLSIFRYCF